MSLWSEQICWFIHSFIHLFYLIFEIGLINGEITILRKYQIARDIYQCIMIKSKEIGKTYWLWPSSCHRRTKTKWDFWPRKQRSWFKQVRVAVSPTTTVPAMLLKRAPHTKLSKRIDKNNITNKNQIRMLMWINESLGFIFTVEGTKACQNFEPFGFLWCRHDVGLSTAGMSFLVDSRWGVDNAPLLLAGKATIWMFLLLVLLHAGFLL